MAAMFGNLQLDHLKPGLVLVAMLVCFNLVQGSTVVVVLAAVVGYLFLPVLQPTRDLFAPAKKAEQQTPVGRALKPKRRVVAQGRAGAKKSALDDVEHDDEEDEEDESSDDMASSFGHASKFSMKKLPRKTLQHKMLTKKISGKKASQPATAATAELPVSNDPVDVMQFAEQVPPLPVCVPPLVWEQGESPGMDASGDAVKAKVGRNLDDAMRGVSHFMELEKRSRAIQQQQQQSVAMGGNAVRSAHSQAAELQVQQAMVAIVKCISEAHRLQHIAGVPWQNVEPPQAFAGPEIKTLGLPMIQSPPPGLEPVASLKRSTLSAAARPFNPIFGSRPLGL